jgi:subfamily B ATP-binding cassette protein HlyB/CyaB
MTGPGLLRPVPQTDWLWTLGSLCALHKLPFSAEQVAHEFPPPHTLGSLLSAARALGLRVRETALSGAGVERVPLPVVVELTASAPQAEGGAEHAMCLGLVTAAAGGRAVLFRPASSEPQTLSLAELGTQMTGRAWLTRAETPAVADVDAASAQGTTSSFGFRWFVPELLRHRQVWRDVLLASLALQLVSLTTPLFMQAVIDKVVVHRTQSTLMAIAVAMAIFLVFSSLLTWTRQYLILHTGNRVDAVLSAAVWGHLLKLPLRYFEHRPTGVVAARLQGVETIREFVSGAAITLALDLPFLLICLAVMVWYSPMLSAVVVGILALIAIASALVAPVLQRRLDAQFLMGARNQAFVTEHIAGFETVKSLQMEPQLRQRWAGYLAAYLQSSFATKQIGNTYSVAASTLDQLQTLLVLMLGAYIVMTEPNFTIGMLVAFQMFAGKLSQPVQRLVGLWSQFQQARLAVLRLGDVMNAPAEPYSLQPRRLGQVHQASRIELADVSFQYTPERPTLYRGFNLVVQAGEAVAVMGPSGSGKSTLAKLLLGFYQPTAGAILVDGTDIRNLSANELRALFGVVPQETILFSGTIWANLTAANPGATFEQVAQACKMSGIHQVIESLPQGYQTEVGERGAGLSGGQKQRLAIARALLKGPRILIFDEATSALDAETAEAFALTVNRLKGRVTMLFIAHALPAKLQVDRVLRLGVRDDGADGKKRGAGAASLGAQAS